jgi:hypothetical protein
VDDVRAIRRVARDDEGLRQLQADSPGIELHAVELTAG